MVEVKTLASPKVAIPIAGIIVLIAVSTLVAMFYIRNPTISDGLFGPSTEEPTSSPSSTLSELDHVTQSATGSSGKDHVIQSTTPSSMHEQASTTASAAAGAPATLPVTSAPNSASTPMHAIEPVQHL